jgi:hypothetical protein
MGRFSVVAGFIAVCSACNVLIDAEPQQCQVDRDCRSKGGEFASTSCVDGYCVEVEEQQQPVKAAKCSKDAECDASEACIEKQCTSRWECVDDKGTTPNPKAVKQTLLVTDILAAPMPNVPAKLCRAVDTSCDSPDAELVSDAQGLFHFELARGFTGYLEVTMEPFFPILYYFPPVLDANTPLPPLALTPVQLIQGLGGAVGAVPDDERGHILLTVLSCMGPAPGVSFSAPKADDKTITYYVQGGIPSQDFDATTSEGSGGFLNFPPGNAVVKLSSGKAGELTALSLTVRAGHITSVAFNPGDLEAGSL